MGFNSGFKGLITRSAVVGRLTPCGLVGRLLRNVVIFLPKLLDVPFQKETFFNHEIWLLAICSLHRFRYGTAEVGWGLLMWHAATRYENEVRRGLTQHSARRQVTARHLHTTRICCSVPTQYKRGNCQECWHGSRGGHLYYEGLLGNEGGLTGLEVVLLTEYFDRIRLVFRW